MTNRIMIQAIGWLTPPVRTVLQPFFATDLSCCPVHVAARPVNDYSSGRTNHQGVWIWEDVWLSDPPANLLAMLAHELTHWEQISRRGWLSVILVYLWTHARSIARGKWYDAELSADEGEAQARQQRVKRELSEELLGILDADAQ